MATRSARPIAASQAEKARSSIGPDDREGESNWRVHNDKER